MTSTIETPRALAKALQEKLKLKPPLNLLPWQMEAPDTTLWWLVPSSDNPAYSHGKLVFSLDKDSPREPLRGCDHGLIQAGTIFAGYHVEKGFGPTAVTAGFLKKTSTELMNPNWVWHRVTEGNGPAQFTNTLAAASNERTTHLYVGSGIPRGSRAVGTAGGDAVVFVCRGREIELACDNEFPDGVLDGVASARSFAELAEHLRGVNDLHWVDLYAGTYVAKGEVDVHALYQTSLAYFEHWVIAAGQHRP